MIARMDRPATPALPDILRDFEPGEFFVLRAAVCPIDVLQADPAHDDADARLREWARDPFVQAAIYLASPTLSQRVAECIAERPSADFAALRPALFRYFVRMATRATPFGLMASFSTGSVGTTWHLELGSRQALRRCSWFDLGFLYPLVRRVVQQPEVRAALTFTLNTTFFRHGDGWRYVAQNDTSQRRERHLARVENSNVLEAIVAACSAGVAVTPRHLIEVVMRTADDVGADDAAAFVDELIDAQILVATLSPTLTGIDPVQHLLVHSENVAPLAAFHAAFRSAAERLAQIDRQEVASLREAYADLANSLQARFGAEGERNLFHVDLRRDAPALSIHRSLLVAIGKAVGTLHRISPPTWPHAVLKRFREQFEERYGDREVDLLAALDEDSGIGFEVDPADRRNEGLLKDLRFPVDAQEPATEPARRTRRLLRIIEHARAKREGAYALDDTDLEALSIAPASPLPDVFTVFGSLGPGAPAGSDPDMPRFVLGYVAAGAGLFGRFCRADGSLERHLKALLRKEEDLRPDAIFAEIVYLPEDRTGNIICRPAFRSKDIAYLGQSGLPPSDRIPASDLAISVRGGRIVLRSRSVGREVLPRITCALNARGRNASVYRFLAALGQQNVQGGLAFSWGPLFEDASFLPRITLGSVVVAPASWHIDPDDALAWSKLAPKQRQPRIADWRSERSVPQWIQIGHFDNLLSLNLEDAGCVEALLDEVHRGKQYRLREMIPAPNELCVRSSEGHHVHEVMIPFVRKSSAVRHVAAAIDPQLLRGERRFVPGSRWLFAKVYGSAMATERALIADLYAWIRERQTAGDIARWFFLRYRDTDDHLRVRFDADPQILDAVVRPKLERLFKNWSDAGAIWRVQFDTYEREVDRYGGAEAIEIAESIFHADSDLVAELLSGAPADAPGDWRWQIAMKVMDQYYQAFGHDLAARREAAERSERAFRAEFRVDKHFEADLSRRYRTERALVEEIAGESALLPAQLKWAQLGVAKFVDRLGPLAAWFRDRARHQPLTNSLASIAASLAHMHVNRMMLANPREHEMIAYAFLNRAYRSRRARGSGT